MIYLMYKSAEFGLVLTVTYLQIYILFSDLRIYIYYIAPVVPVKLNIYIYMLSFTGTTGAI